MKKITDGHTENGTRVEVWRADSDSEIVRSLVKNYADLGPAYRVLIDNVPVQVTSEDSLRDGGTVYLKLATGQTIHYPAPERGEPRFDPRGPGTPLAGSPRSEPSRVVLVEGSAGRAVKSPVADSLEKGAAQCAEELADQRDIHKPQAKMAQRRTVWSCTGCGSIRAISDRWCPICGSTVYRPV